MQSVGNVADVRAYVCVCVCACAYVCVCKCSNWKLFTEQFKVQYCTHTVARTATHQIEQHTKEKRKKTPFRCF